MKILLDENVPDKYKRILIRNGYKDIKRINDFGKGIPDSEVYNIAQKEQRTIISIDTDFFIYKRQDNYGIISISGKLLNPIETVIKTLEQIKKDTTINQYVFKNTFIRLTTQYFEVVFKKKGKYKTVRRKYK